MCRLAGLAIFLGGFLAGAQLPGSLIQAQDYSQNTIPGTISGRVRSVGGTALRGASVEVINTRTSESRVIDSGDEGDFRISGLQLGIYRIVVRARGYQAKTAPEVELAAGAGQELEVALKRQQPDAPIRAIIPF